MAGSRGYHSYRGRAPRWKMALAVVLVLVILIAIAFMMLQEYMVYDEAGIPHLRLPEKQEEQMPPEEEVELTIQAPEKADAICVLALPEGALRAAAVEAALAEEGPYDALAVTLKSGGQVYFDATAAVSGAVRVETDTAAALEMLTTQERTAIARIGCFRDPKAANSDVEGLGLKNTGGYIFYDGSNSQWLDPAKPAARAYLCALAQEVAALGFDEILLSDVSYPTEGKLDKIDYGAVDKAAVLADFLKEMRQALEPYGVVLSIQLSEEAVITGRDEAAGVELAEIAPLVDRIYVPTVPEQVDSLAARIFDVSSNVDFVPELMTYDQTLKGSSLILK